MSRLLVVSAPRPVLTVDRIMIADAHAQRKYEDGKALSQALSDIRSEIARVADQVIT